MQTEAVGATWRVARDCSWERTGRTVVPFSQPVAPGLSAEQAGNLPGARHSSPARQVARSTRSLPDPLRRLGFRGGTKGPQVSLRFTDFGMERQVKADGLKGASPFSTDMHDPTRT